MKVLVAVRDPAAGALWHDVVTDHGHDPLRTMPDLEAWPLIESARPLIGIVELRPDLAGALQLCGRLRHPGWSPRPIFIALVPANNPGDMLAALRSGADDLVIGTPDRRTALSHLVALERRCHLQLSTSPTAHDLAAGYAVQPIASTVEQEPASLEASPHLESAAFERNPPDEAATVLDALERHLTDGMPDLAAARRVAGELRRMLGIAPAEPAAAELEDTGEPIILLIDDEASVRYPLRLALQHSGYRVLEAADGDEGLELLARWEHQIALVVLDHRMPRMSGAAVLREIRRRAHDLPVVFMSGQSPADTGVAHLEPTAYLRKPFQLGDLARTVQRCLATPRDERSA
jgi:DNA-binding response OmpR family regulator